MKAVSQLYIAGLGHFVMVSNVKLIQKCIISALHGWSMSSCNDM